VVSTEFDFVEPDKKKAYKKEKIFITQRDIDVVGEQIKTVWAKIQDHDFTPGVVKTIAIGAILLKIITSQLRCMKWKKKSLNRD
jgi:hypothetical protein